MLCKQHRIRKTNIARTSNRNLHQEINPLDLKVSRTCSTHSSSSYEPVAAEIIEVRASDTETPVVVVPTSFNSVTIEEFAEMGVNIVITANHMLLAAYPAMLKVAKSILANGRSLEAEPYCMSIKDIFEFIPGTK